MLFACLMAFVVILLVLIVFGVIVYTILDGVRSGQSCAGDCEGCTNCYDEDD